MIRSVIVWVVAALWSVTAFAQGQGWKINGQPELGYFGSQESACRAAADAYGKTRTDGVTLQFARVDSRPDSGVCYGRLRNSNGQYISGEIHYATAVKATWTCEDGQKEKIEFRIGWTKYFQGPGGEIQLINGNSHTPIPPQEELPLDVCYKGCKFYYDGDEHRWVQPPEGGDVIVPRFGTAEYVANGVVCTQDFDPNLAGDKPDDPGDEEPPSEDPPGGGDTDNPGGGRGPGDGHGPGEGGDGDDPGDAEDNGPGGGNNDNPSEAQCGVQGKPPCNTSIDETGTPSGPGDKMDTGKIGEEFEKLRNQLDRIGDRSTKDTSWGVVPSWFRTGGCAPMNLGSYGHMSLTIDHCPAVPYAQGAASFMWIVVTFFAVTAMVGRTLGAGTGG